MNYLNSSKRLKRGAKIALFETLSIPEYDIFPQPFRSTSRVSGLTSSKTEDGQPILALAPGGVHVLSGQAGLKERMRRLTNKQLFVEEVTFLIPIGGNS